MVTSFFEQEAVDTDKLNQAKRGIEPALGIKVHQQVLNMARKVQSLNQNFLNLWILEGEVGRGARRRRFWTHSVYPPHHHLLSAIVKDRTLGLRDLWSHTVSGISYILMPHLKGFSFSCKNRFFQLLVQQGAEKQLKDEN